MLVLAFAALSFAIYGFTFWIGIPIFWFLYFLFERIKNRHNYHDFVACELYLEESGFGYKELKGRYSIFVEYNRIVSISLKEYRGIKSAVLGIDKQSELICSDVNDIDKLAVELKLRAGL